jgi:hypothetical protein
MTKIAKKVESSLFSEQRRWLFATNRANVLPVLSSGLVRPMAAYEKYYDDLLSRCPGLIPVWPGDIPASVVPLLTAGAPGMFPVLLEIDPAGADSRVVACVAPDGRVQSFGAGGGNSDVLCNLICSPIPYSAISCIHFFADADRDDFVARDFENVLTLPPLKVSPALFSGSGLDAGVIENALRSASSVGANEVDYRRIDCAMGAIALLSLLAPVSCRWFEALAAATSFPSSAASSPPGISPLLGTLVAAILRSERGISESTDVDDRLLGSAIAVLTAASPKEGWVEAQVVREIVSRALVGASSRDAKDIEDWGQVVVAVARADRQAGPLDDSGSIIRRALMLLVLRGTPDRIIKSVETTLHPGPQVAAIAGMLSGLFWGYSRLARPLKLQACSPTVLSQLAVVWSEGGALRRNSPVVKASLQRVDPTTARLAVMVGDSALVSRELRPDDSMMRVFYHARTLGYLLEFDPEISAFVHELQSVGGGARRIIIESGRATLRGQKTIRVRTVCTASGGKPIRLAKREDALALLERNHAPATQCRFAVAPQSGSVEVIADQILEAMDSVELQAHVEAVSSTASSFEELWNARRDSEPVRTVRGKGRKSAGPMTLEEAD